MECVFSKDPGSERINITPDGIVGLSARPSVREPESAHPASSSFIDGQRPRTWLGIKHAT